MHRTPDSPAPDFLGQAVYGPSFRDHNRTSSSYVLLAWVAGSDQNAGAAMDRPIDTAALRCGASCNLVKGGADHLTRPDVRSSLEHLA